MQSSVPSSVQMPARMAPPTPHPTPTPGPPPTAALVHAPAAAGAPPLVASPARPAASVPTLDDLRRRWPELARAALLQGQAVLAAALTGTSVVALDAGVLTIEIAPGRTPPPPDMDAQLQPYLASISAHGLRLAFIAAKAVEGDDRTRRYQAAKAHPVIREFIKRFDGEVIRNDVVTRDEWQARVEREL